MPWEIVQEFTTLLVTIFDVLVVDCSLKMKYQKYSPDLLYLQCIFSSRFPKKLNCSIAKFILFALPLYQISYFDECFNEYVVIRKAMLPVKVPKEKAIDVIVK